MSTGNALYSPSTGRVLYSPSTGRALYSGVENSFITRRFDIYYRGGLRTFFEPKYDNDGNPRPAIRSDFWPRLFDFMDYNGITFYETNVSLPLYCKASWESRDNGGSSIQEAVLFVHDMSDVLADYDYLRAIRLNIYNFASPPGSGQPMIGLLLSDTLTTCTSPSCMESGVTHTIESAGQFTWQLGDLPLKKYLFLYQFIKDFEIPTDPGSAEYGLIWSQQSYSLQMHLI